MATVEPSLEQIHYLLLLSVEKLFLDFLIATEWSVKCAKGTRGSHRS